VTSETSSAVALGRSRASTTTRPAFLRDYAKEYGKKFAPEWWYTDHPFLEDGRTWLLDKSWGVNTEPALTALVGRFPDVGVSFRRADPE